MVLTSSTLNYATVGCVLHLRLLFSGCLKGKDDRTTSMLPSPPVLNTYLVGGRLLFFMCCESMMKETQTSASVLHVPLDFGGVSRG